MRLGRVVLIVAVLFSTTAYGQRYHRLTPLRRYAFGVKTGTNISTMRLTEDCYNIYKHRFVPCVSLGAWFQYRSEEGIAIRPELALMGRSAEIYCHDVVYRVSSTCMNLRFNLQLHMYLPRTTSSIYFVVAPSWYATLGGYIRFSSEDIPLLKMNLSSSSMNVHDANIFVGMGLESPLSIAKRSLYFSGELGYSFCLTNSFTNAEQTNNINVLNDLLYSYPNTGSRIFSGIEASIRIGLPFGKRIRIRR